ncbi:MAG: hypothetical protein IKD37_02585 [Clostridia bacterium]|nr:hypothetical protein [Clostridia bacterium]
MGFGILFLGYLITYLLSLNPFAALTRLCGYIIMFAALTMLRRHNRWFAYAQLTGIPLALLALINTAADFASRAAGGATPDVLARTAGPLESAMTIFVLVFHFFLLFAIYAIAAETELPRLARAARMNLLLIIAYGILHGIWLLPLSIGDSYTQTLGFMVFVLQLLWTACNLVLIFRCYMWICLEGDEDMAQKPSRFAFVNRMREKKQAHDQKAHDEAVAYAREKRARRASKLGPAATKPKYKKKKKKK